MNSYIMKYISDFIGVKMPIKGRIFFDTSNIKNMFIMIYR